MNVGLLTTGGTIASAPGPDGTVGVAVAGRDLHGLDDWPVPVTVREVALRHSFALSLAEVRDLVSTIRAEAAQYDGLVVTHGTDTLEETAYLLDLVTPADSVPVVLTGAQRHAGERDGDGPRNLADAVRIAASPAARGLGPLVVMDGRIHAARQAVKAHTLALDAFASFDGGPIGEVRRGSVRIWSSPVRPAGFDLAPVLPRVDVVTSYVGADGVQLAACREAGARGIVLEALGAGNPTPGLLAEVRRCLSAGLPVLVTSRCVSGPTAAIYGHGGGADLAASGALMAGSLPSSKARLLLSIALATDALPRLGDHLAA
ncbi:L-asparaginase [Kribbella voronezhensis]|uniref:asparaginase n=1 Tax=Kribbella voronezhensis TaxID=2512212 RepID=A0A4R7SZJ2_9ACTN|nr:asparaginase [Kribbella voronezhensis]TDU83977.1 L-asparaginase [Kribbella voronezhensis]